MDKIHKEQERLVRAQNKIIDKLAKCKDRAKKQDLRSRYMNIVLKKDENRKKLAKLWEIAEKESTLSKS